MTDSRAQRVLRWLPTGIPRLWCPPLTHYARDGQLDPVRTAVHLRHLGRHAHGWLIPGSTGEGWQMSDDQVREVLDCALSVAAQVDARVLVGVLRQDASSARACIEQTVDWLCHRAETDDVERALVQQHVCGFTVCPPTGAALTVDELRPACAKCCN